MPSTIHHAHGSSLAVTTSREDFQALAAEHRVVPVTRKVLADSET
ncbi:MAG: anthranilate synthase component, partial [Mycobacterium sp.]|nr:anthranilate synthase component [Mycobacterium sp.]